MAMLAKKRTTKKQEGKGKKTCPLHAMMVFVMNSRSH